MDISVRRADRLKKSGQNFRERLPMIQCARVVIARAGRRRPWWEFTRPGALGADPAGDRVTARSL